jgi:hypothetical protein
MIDFFNILYRKMIRLLLAASALFSIADKGKKLSIGVHSVITITDTE